MDIDLTTLTDDQLAELRAQAEAEQERRSQLPALARQVEAIAELYEAGGGDRADLAAILAPAGEPYV